MDLTGILCEVSRDYKTKKPMVKFLVNENIDGIESLDGKNLKIKVSKATNPRSLDARSEPCPPTPTIITDFVAIDSFPFCYREIIYLFVYFHFN